MRSFQRKTSACLRTVAVAYFNYEYNTVSTCTAALLLSLTYKASRGPLYMTAKDSCVQCIFIFKSAVVCPFNGMA